MITQKFKTRPEKNDGEDDCCPHCGMSHNLCEHFVDRWGEEMCVCLICNWYWHPKS